MRRRAWGSVLLLSVLLLAGTTLTEAQPLAEPEVGDQAIVAGLGEERLVVFEAFMRSTGANCLAAAPAIDKLADDYSEQPVVFLEHDIDHLYGDRYGRWWTAYRDGGSAVGPSSLVQLPLVMVDSGQQITNGVEDFESVYKGMVDASMARPAELQITASTLRDGRLVRADVEVTNQSAISLTGSINAATVHLLVYEHVSADTTSRIVRGAASMAIEPALDPGATATFTLETGKLSGIEWSEIRCIVLIDYLPGGTEGAYDMLQAAHAPFAENPAASETYLPYLAH